MPSEPPSVVARLVSTLSLTLALFASSTSCSSRQKPSDEHVPAPGASAEPTHPPTTQQLGRAPDYAPHAEGRSVARPPICTPPPSPRESRGAPGVDVSVRAERGPRGRASPVPISRFLYGMNIADWEPRDYAPAPRPAYQALLAALRPGVLRWPAGHRSQEYTWERAGDGSPGNWTLTATHVDAFIALARSVGAAPVVAINVKRGGVSAAKDLLRYMNVERRYGVQWLQIGNEPDLTDGMTSGPEIYGDQLVRFVDALREVDPNVRIVGPEMLTGAHVGGAHDTVDWMTPILIKAAGRIDGISWHYYPLDSGQANPASSAIVSVEHLFQESANDWRPASLAYVDEIMPALSDLRTSYAPHAEVWITELAEDPGPAAGLGISDTVAGALWVGDVLGRYGAYGPGAVIRWLFKGSAMHAYGLVGPDDVPRPAYGAYWLYARHFGDRFVDATSSATTEVAAHAALRADGALTLVLVNKKTESRRVRLSIEGFFPCSGEALTLVGDGHAATTFSINDEPLTPASASAGITPVTMQHAELLDLTLPPTSMRLVVYQP